MFLSDNIKKQRYEKYLNEDYDLLENDLSDKKFLNLKPTNRLAEDNSSENAEEE